MPATTITVLVPSHRRPRELRRCLSQVVGQLAEGDELLVVHRDGDEETSAAAAGAWADTVLVPVTESGVWVALAAGVRAARCDVVAFLDDDAIPMDGWLDAIRRHMRDPSTGAVGGPILNFRGVRTSNSFFSGERVTWATRSSRLHSRLHQLPAHRRVDEVDFLPGSNMAVRRPLLDLDRHPMINMAPSWEWRVGLDVKRRGFRIVYDSDIKVEHHPAPRELSRTDQERIARDVGYSMVAIAGTGLRGTRRFQSLAWWMLMGSRESPGLLLAPAAVLAGRTSPRAWRGALHGRVLGLASACRTRGRV
ncbi:glycosyltransferase family 2 protein [Streptomyces sp. NBC_01483]